MAAHTARFSFRFADPADAAAVLASLAVERDDEIPGVDAAFFSGEGSVLELALASDDLGNLRAATKSFLTRVRAAAAALDPSGG